jgi:hypothetical protein
MRSFLSLVLCAAVASGLLVPRVAVAAVTPASVTYAPTFGTIMAPSIARDYFGVAERTAGRASLTNGSSSSVVMHRNVPITVAGQANATAQASKVMTSTALGRAAARFIPLVGAGMLIGDIADAIRCKMGNGADPEFGAPIECDAGAEPEATTVVEYCFGADVATCNSNGAWASTPAAAVTAMEAVITAAYTGAPWFGSLCPSFITGTDAFGPTQFQERYLPPGGTNCTTGYSTGATRNRIQHNAPGTGCPAGQTLSPWDTKCSTGTYAPKTVPEVGDMIESHPSFQADPKEVAREVVDNMPWGVEIPETSSIPTTVSGPGTVTGTPTSTVAPGGTTTSTPSWSITYEGDKFSWGDTTIITTGPGGTTTTTSPTEFKTCGLPGTPACKIDETGTPDGSEAASDAAAKITAARDAAIAQVDEIAHPSSLGWAFSLPLPEGACSAFSITTNRFGTHQFFTICGNPNVEIMRALWAWAVGIMAAAYIWWRVNQTIQGQ